MPDDPLAEFRKTPPVPRGGVIPPKAADEYVAFGTKDKVNRLRIRSVMAPVNSPGYHILLNVVYDGEFGTNFVLLFTVLMVLVRGKNLQKVVFAIEKFGEVHQQGAGKTWWERSLIFASQARQAVRETVMDTWQALLNSRQPGGQDIPSPGRGPDITR